MTTETAIIIPHLENLPTPAQAEWQRFAREAWTALRGVDADLLKQWGRDCLSVAVQATLTRAEALRGLLSAVVKGAWKEFKRFFRALVRGEVTTYVKDACRRLWAAMRGVWQRVKAAFVEVKTIVAQLREASPAERMDLAASFLGGVLGFVFMGGLGDGGAVDMDIPAFGIGGHRSIFFHSIFIGLAAEVCFRSAFRLIELCHQKLPAKHSPLWDRLLAIHRRFNDALITGSWLGVAAHLTIDSHLDGWTPYKDLPVVLPTWGHHLVMDMNAAAAGWFAWQWHKTKRLFRDDSIRPAIVDGRQAVLLKG